MAPETPIAAEPPKAPPLSHVLVAADASNPSRRAVARAAVLARAAGTKLSIVHVVRDMQVPEALLDMADVEKIIGVRGDLLVYVGNKILREAREIAAANGKREADMQLVEGDPAQAIVEHAKAIGADLIVLGTRGLGKLRSTILGSVSRKVANICDLDVLIVR